MHTAEPLTESEAARITAAVMAGQSVGAAVRNSYEETDADAHAEQVWHDRYDGQAENV